MTTTSGQPMTRDALLALAACPFCGAPAEFREAKLHDTWFVRCTECDCKTDTSYSKYEPADTWNRRAAPAPAAGEPVGYMAVAAVGGGKMFQWAERPNRLKEDATALYRDGYRLIPLYATPQEPPTVGEPVAECCVPSAGEPSFVLLGRDPQAPALVEQWARDRQNYEPGSDKPAKALVIATAMRAFKAANPDMGMPTPPLATGGSVAATIAALVEAVRTSRCPHPANGDPWDCTAGMCFDLGHCGCNNGTALELTRGPVLPLSQEKAS